MPRYRCTEPECAERFVEASRFVGDCPECGSPAVLDDEADAPWVDAPLTVPGGRTHVEQSHPAHARQMALRVLRENGVGRAPVPVHAIARNSGLKVVERDDLAPLSGRLADGRIEVASQESENRKRFTIAHELGHHFLHTTHDSAPTAEQEANAFAGELLVPAHLLRNELNRTTSVEELRRIFRVSRDVVEIAASTHHLQSRLS